MSIINICTVRSSEIPKCIYIIENALYLLWTHFNIFFSMLDLSPQEVEEVDTLKTQAEATFSDAFFSKIQAVTQVNYIDLYF